MTTVPASLPPAQIPRQSPLLHTATIVLRAPNQAWSAADGSMHSGIHGYYLADVRLISGLQVTVGGHQGDLLAAVPRTADSVTFVSAQPHLQGSAADPQVRTRHTRTVTADDIHDDLVLQSNLNSPLTVTVQIQLQPDLTPMPAVRAGVHPAGHPTVTIDGDTATWTNTSVHSRLTAPDAALTSLPGGALRLDYTLTVPVGAEGRIRWSVAATGTCTTTATGLRGDAGPVPWSVPTLTSADTRLNLWLQAALADLDALRLRTPAGDVLLAPGAPWNLGLDATDPAQVAAALGAARMLLPLGTDLAGGTLRAFSQPGHDSVHATPLWICLLHDAWRWGLPPAAVRDLLPQLKRSLECMGDLGDTRSNGFLECTAPHCTDPGCTTDAGCAADTRADGTHAIGPRALAHVQGYAFEAARHGADLLDHFGQPGGDAWRGWASALQRRLSAAFWVDSPQGAFPARALDAATRPIGAVASGLGHLLGTGLLSTTQSALVARRLVSPELSSGFGLRTLGTDSDGYWPLSRNGGSVSPHDTAVAIAGLTAGGFTAEAGVLVSGVLAAASQFEYRLPERYSGDAAQSLGRPVPHPAAARPHALSAAAAVSVLVSALGLSADADAGVLGVSPAARALAPLRVSGLVFAGAQVALNINEDGEVSAASGAAIEVS